MNIEDRLREALQAAADAMPAALADIPHRERERSPRRRARVAAIATAACVLIAALILGVVVSDGDHRAARVTATGPDRTGRGSGDPAVLVYGRGTETMAVLADGREVPLEGVGRGARLSPDGRLLLYVEGEWPDQETMLLDITTGERRSLGRVARGGFFDLEATFSGAGEVVVPVARGEYRKPMRLEVRSVPSFDLVRTITLGDDSAGKHFVAPAWDTDDRHLVVFTWDTEEAWAWWSVDTHTGDVQQLDVDRELNPTQHESFFLGPADSPGVFPALLGGGWGQLRVDADGKTSFTTTGPPGPQLDVNRTIAGYWEVGTLRIRRGERGLVIDDHGPADGRLISYFEQYRDDSGALTYRSASGHTEDLLTDIAWIAVAPHALAAANVDDPSSLPRCPNTIHGFEDPPVTGESGDALPPVGSSSRAAAQRAQEALRIEFHGVRAVVVETQGRAWQETQPGQITIVPETIYSVLVTLRDRAACPEAPVFANGVPVMFEFERA